MPRSSIKTTLLFFIVFIMATSRVVAQVRENPDMLLAPALEVFAGTATRDEYILVATFLVAGGLFAAVIAVNILWFLRQLTLKLFIRIFAVWLLLASGGAMIALVGYVTGPQSTSTRADASSMPRDVRANVLDDQIIIQWSTNRTTVGAVKLINIPDQPTLLSNIGKPSIYHQVKIPRRNLQRFEFVVMSDGLEYRLNGSPLIIEMP